MAPALRMINGVPDMRVRPWYKSEWAKIAAFLLGGSGAISGVAWVAMKSAAVAMVRAGGISLQVDVDAQFASLRAAELASFKVTQGRFDDLAKALAEQTKNAAATAKQIQSIERRIKRLPVERHEP